jgi:hypothetical protein
MIGPIGESFRLGVAVSRVSRRLRIWRVIRAREPDPMGFWTRRAERRRVVKRRR